MLWLERMALLLSMQVDGLLMKAANVFKTSIVFYSVRHEMERCSSQFDLIATAIMSARITLDSFEFFEL